MPKLGERVAYRGLPADFEDVFITGGWNGAKETYSTHTRVIRRFLEQAGRDRLIAARAEYVGKYGRKSVASRYVMGLRLMSLDNRKRGVD